MTPAELLRAHITKSGLSPDAFARKVLMRHPATLYRWLQGAPMPQSVLDWLNRKRRNSAKRP